MAARASAIPFVFRKHANVFVVLPSSALLLLFVYGFTFWSFILSLTVSRAFPVYQLEGVRQYILLWTNDRWITSVLNLLIFTTFFVGLATVLGLIQAILLDQRVRAENTLRTIYLYPMAISFIVTGTAWKWILNPGLGIERMVRSWGIESFTFDWILSQDMAIYTLVIAAVWQSSGFAMAMFLAALRSVDGEIIKAAKIDGASAYQTYRHIVMPLLRPALFTSIVILVAIALRCFDLMVSMTGGGPGIASDLPTNFFYQFAFGRNRLALAAASGVTIFLSVVCIMGPYIYGELKREPSRAR